MNRRSNSVESLVREAFALLLELRAHPDASHMLSLANAFLDMLLRQKGADEPPMLISVQAVRIRKG